MPKSQLIPLLVLLAQVSCDGRQVSTTTDGTADPTADGSAGHADAAPPMRDAAPQDDPLCAGITCGLVNDCCACQAYDNTLPPPMPPCIQNCFAPRCESMNIAAPRPYCVHGQCLLTGGAERCTADTDCALVNDCCTCAALPLAPAKLAQSQCAAACEQGACDALGLMGAEARCVAGVCRVVLP